MSGLRIQATTSVNYNPNLNPEPAVRAFPGPTDGLLCAYQLDNSPTPSVPVAGSFTAQGTIAGDLAFDNRGLYFDTNDWINTGANPGSSLTAFTMFFLGRRTGVTPSGAVTAASAISVGPATSAGFRLQMTDGVYVFGSPALFTPGELAPFGGDTTMFELIVASASTSGVKFWKPRIQSAPISKTTTNIATVGAAQLDNPVRIGTAGTNIKWSEAQIMAAGLYVKELSDSEVAALYAGYQAYAGEIGVSI